MARTRDTSSEVATSWRRRLGVALLILAGLVAASSLGLPWFERITSNQDTGAILQAATLRPWEHPGLVALLCLPLALLVAALLPVVRHPRGVPSLAYLLTATGFALVCLLGIAAGFLRDAIVSGFPGMGAGGRIPRLTTMLVGLGFWLSVGAYLGAPVVFWLFLRPVGEVT